jgi:Fe-S-cluster-containing hydrogenase component 2
MVEHSLKISQGATDIIPTLPSPEASDQIYGLGAPSLFPADAMKHKRGEMRINAEKCTGCGLCAEACFCDNIDASVFPPVFKIQPCPFESETGPDFYCEGVCPTGAIEFDFQPPDPNAGKTRNIMHKTLDLAEATGRFRRLVKEEDIGWQTPWEIASGHPRIKEIP